MSHPPLVVLRRARRVDDDLPLEVLDALWRVPAGFAADPALARTVVADDGRTLHVVAGPGCVGLFERTGEGGLWTPEELRDGRAVLTRVVGPGRLRVQGLVDDEVLAVRLRLQDGARVRVDVHDGVHDVVLECLQEGDLPAELLLERVGATRSVALPCCGGDVLGLPA